LDTLVQKRPSAAPEPEALHERAPESASPDGNVAGQSARDGWTPRSVYTLVLLTLIWAISFADRQMLGLLAPLIKADLELSDTSLGLITGFVFVLLYSVLGVPVARLADRASRRNILAAGVAVWSLMTGLSGLAANVWQLTLARLLMGAGEAAANAPATTLAADIAGPRRRQTAMAVLSTGSGLSALLLLPPAGWIAQAWGWRGAFMAAGWTGLALCGLLLLTVREPPRAPAPAAGRPRDDALGAARFLLGSRAYVLTVLGGAFVGVSLYASQAWHPSFLARVHHLPIGEVGLASGVLRGVAGIIGTLLGGVLAERLARRDARWLLLTPGLACILALPAELLFLLSPDLKLALTGMLGYHLFIGMHFGPIYVACHALARPTMRATATAVFLLVANLTGQIVGPLAVGFLNDQWAAAFGEEAIRYSLLLGGACVLAGGLILTLASRTVEADVRRAAA
jgi:predicted MFS family arabinose efflux permease